MIALRDEGLIGGIGLSNVTLERVQRRRGQRTEVACVQNAYNLADRSDQAVFDACQTDGVPYVPFFPLGSAFHPENPVLGTPAVKETAQRLGATPAQVALAWLLQPVSHRPSHPGHVLAGAPGGEPGRRPSSSSTRRPSTHSPVDHGKRREKANRNLIAP